MRARFQRRGHATRLCLAFLHYLTYLESGVPNFSHWHHSQEAPKELVIVLLLFVSFTNCDMMMMGIELAVFSSNPHCTCLSVCLGTSDLVITHDGTNHTHTQACHDSVVFSFFRGLLDLHFCVFMWRMCHEENQSHMVLNCVRESVSHCHSVWPIAVLIIRISRHLTTSSQSLCRGSDRRRRRRRIHWCEHG